MIMTKREQYQLTFQKLITSDNWVFNFASTPDLSYGDIATHLTSSDKFYTNAQLEAIAREQAEGSSDYFWGELMGSSLYFHSDGTVEIGDADTVMPLGDFKGLLQEWLAFIS